MAFATPEQFLKTFAGIRKRTRRLLDLVPADQLEWKPGEGRFSLGDLFRHIAASERFMWAENAAFRPGRYSGCGEDLASGLDAVVAFFDRCHEESMAIFEGLSAEDLARETTLPYGNKMVLGKWLTLMTEHEVHHRGQIYTYLGLMGIKTPPIFGLTENELVKNSQG